MSDKGKKLSFKTNTILNLLLAIISFVFLQISKLNLLKYHFSDFENFAPCFFEFLDLLAFFFMIMVICIRTDVVDYSKEPQFNRTVAIIKDSFIIVLFLTNLIVWWR